ncbi:hypothetical protein [Acinetobacter sp. YH12153]|uniref:hypothetical protein n=1 Tax=Acinetobacter sp. YH12153 TaxID=2601133 RepID=UPI0015D11CE7|nr:hypothetical protein [Acinetobacter sp. YH12153]
MNANIQNLIRSFSPEKRKEIQDYVVQNMSAEIREATLHGSVSPQMQNELEGIIIKYLELHYPDDIKHTITQAQNEVEEQIGNLVNKQLDFMATQPVEETPQENNAVEEVAPVPEEAKTSFLFNMGAKPRTYAQVIPPEQLQTIEAAKTAQEPVAPSAAHVNVEPAPVAQIQTPVPAPTPVAAKQAEDDLVYADDENLLGENTGYHQRHDHEDRFFGMQLKIYKLLALTDDESAESYFRIGMVIAAIMIFLGAWNLFNDFTTISSMQNYFYVKNPVYMRQLAEFCQTSMSNIKQFQDCVANRQADLILGRRLDAVKDFFVIAAGGVLFFIAYFLKLNYRGREAYLNREDY